MKFKKFLLACAGVFAFALAACDSKNNTSTDSGKTNPPTVDPEPSQPSTQSMYLGFMDNNKIRVDILSDDLGIRFNYGNTAVTSTQSMDLVAGQKLSFSGTIAVDSINFIIVRDTETGGSVSVNAGIVKDSVEDYLSGKSFTDVKKVYIAISTGTVNWTKGLNPDLDAKIQTYIQK